MISKLYYFGPSNTFGQDPALPMLHMHKGTGYVTGSSHAMKTHHPLLDTHTHVKRHNGKSIFHPCKSLRFEEMGFGCLLTNMSMQIYSHPFIQIRKKLRICPRKSDDFIKLLM